MEIHVNILFDTHLFN